MANALFCRPPLGSAHRRLSKMDGQVKCAEATSLTGRLRSNDKIIAVSLSFSKTWSPLMRRANY